VQPSSATKANDATSRRPGVLRETDISASNHPFVGSVQRWALQRRTAAPPSLPGMSTVTQRLNTPLCGVYAPG